MTPAISSSMSPLAVPAIRNRRLGKVGPEARSEPPVRQRKGAGQAGVEGQILLGPVAHGEGGVGVRGELLDGRDEAVVGPAAVLEVARLPALRGHALGLRRASTAGTEYDLAGRRPVGGGGSGSPSPRPRVPR